MRQHLTGASKRKLWKTPADIERGLFGVATRWEEQLKALTWPTPEDGEIAALLGRGPTHWRLLDRKDNGTLVPQLQPLEKELKKKMHGRKRSEWRHNINAQSAAWEDARKRGETAAIIRSVFGTHTDQYDMNLLRLPDGSTVTDPVRIHEEHSNHWAKWHQGTGRKTFFDDHRIDWRNAAASKPAFMNYPAHAHIPPYILDRLWNALIQPTENLPHLSALMASTISAPSL